MSAPTVAYHGLFLPEDGLNDQFEPEPIGKIYVKRFDASGVTNVPQWFSPDGLREPADLFVRWGGGSYEVTARRPDGSIYAKRLYSFPGPPKAIVDPSAIEATPTSNAAPTHAPPPGLDPMIAMLMQQSAEAAARSQAMILGLVTALAPVLAAVVGGQKEKGSSPAEMMQAFAALTAANKPPPSAPPTPLAEVLNLQRAIDEAASLRTQAAAQTARALQPEESTADTIRAIAEVAAPLLMASNAGSAAAAAAAAAKALPG